MGHVNPSSVAVPGARGDGALPVGPARDGPIGRENSLQWCMRLLIIEDDRPAADYLVKAFREVGHVADHAGDGEDGLAMALDGGYDVLIVDRMLPKLDGLWGM